MNKESYVHFTPEERPFVDKVSEWLERSSQRHAVKITDFLDPRQLSIIQALAGGNQEAAVRFDGGYNGAERKRAILVPDYRDPNEEDAGIRVLSVTSPDEKISSLDHGDYMGAILGLGVKRDKIGDIHVRPDGCHYLVADEIGDYLNLNLHQVHRVSVTAQLLPIEQLIPSESELEEMNLSVASMRLDGIVSDVCRLSRAKALVPIKAGRCRVNWKSEEDPSKPLKEGDVVSLQGFGRFKVLEVEGLTKKGRIRVKVGKYI